MNLKGNQKFPKSPLRYPGGKARAVNQILSLIPYNIQRLVSPFLGGGSIELAAAHLGVEVKGYDIFQPLIVFWNALLNDRENLVNNVNRFFPLSKERFYDLQKTKPKTEIETAAVFYVLNRSSFSGSTLSGGMSPGHPRFNKSSISYLNNFTINNFTVEKGDFHDTIPKHTGCFLYLDPPYMIQQTLYGNKGDAHKGFDHEGLSELLRKRDNWLLSYNDSKSVRELYKGFRMINPKWSYGMSSNKQSNELLILSNDLPMVDRKGLKQMKLFEDTY